MYNIHTIHTIHTIGNSILYMQNQRGAQEGEQYEQWIHAKKKAAARRYICGVHVVCMWYVCGMYVVCMWYVCVCMCM